MNPFKRLLAWLKPQEIDRHEPDHAEQEAKPKEESARMKHRRRTDMKKRRVNLYRPGPFFPKLRYHPFLQRAKATRLQTLGQKSLRGKYILETDPPSEERLLVHMHSHVRWMATAKGVG